MQKSAGKLLKMVMMALHLFKYLVPCNNEIYQDR